MFRGFGDFPEPADQGGATGSFPDRLVSTSPAVAGRPDVDPDRTYIEAEEN